jgi:trehalose 6-phosphate phosphatase
MWASCPGFRLLRKVPSLNYVFPSLKQICLDLSGTRRTYVFLDYDGTLTPIVDEPEHAELPEKNRVLLRALASRHECVLAIVSGRSLTELKKLARLRGIYYVGNHGFEIEGPKINFVHPQARALSHDLNQVSKKIQTRLEGVSYRLEDKGLTLSVHYRNTPPSDVNSLLRVVRDIAKGDGRLKLVRGKKVLELRPRVNWDKGAAVQLIMRKLGRGFPIYIGDDRTDEDAFMRIKSGVTILVSGRRKHSHAKYFLKNIHDVYDFLNLLAMSMDARNPLSFCRA